MRIDHFTPEELAILRDRAARLASAARDGRERTVAHRVAVVEVGTERFGLPALGLRGLTPIPTITSLRGLPAWMSGIAQVRGEVTAVVHLARWFGCAEEPPPRHLAVLEARPGRLGALVGNVLGFREIFADELADDLGAIRTERPVVAVTNDLVSILDLDRLMAADGIRVRAP